MGTGFSNPAMSTENSNHTKINDFFLKVSLNVRASARVRACMRACVRARVYVCECVCEDVDSLMLS